MRGFGLKVVPHALMDMCDATAAAPRTCEETAYALVMYKPCSAHLQQP